MLFYVIIDVLDEMLAVVMLFAVGIEIDVKQHVILEEVWKSTNVFGLLYLL